MPNKKYQFAVIATDVVVFTVFEGSLRALLIKMKKEPFEGMWAVPGGLVKPDESVDSAAQRQLVSKTGVKEVYLEQLYTFGKVNRDPFGRVVSVAYFALIPNTGIKLYTTDEYADVAWFPVNKLPPLAYDHKEIIKTAITRLISKLEYTNVVYSLLPNNFTLTDLQEIYQIILGKKLDKRNFRKKILSLGLIKKTGKRQVGEGGRPAELFNFVKRAPQVVEMI